MTLNEHIEKHYYFHEHKQRNGEYTKEDLRLFRLRRSLMRWSFLGMVVILMSMIGACVLEVPYVVIPLAIPFSLLFLWLTKLDPDKSMDWIGS